MFTERTWACPRRPTCGWAASLPCPPAKTANSRFDRQRPATASPAQTGAAYTPQAACANGLPVVSLSRTGAQGERPRTSGEPVR